MARNAWIGRQLSAFAQNCGLVEVTIHGTTPVFTDWPQANQVLGLDRAAEQAVSEGVISSVEAAAWIRDLEQRAAAGRFFSAITDFLLTGRNPDDVKAGQRVSITDAREAGAGRLGDDSRG
jgi:hypothetical protein